MQLVLEAQVAAPPGAVVKHGLAVDASFGHRAEQGQDRRHPGPAAHEDQVAVGGVAQGEDPERPGQLQPVTDLQLFVEILREQPVRVDLDDELELPAFPGRRVRHRERPDLIRAGHGDVHVLAREELEISLGNQPQHQVPHVVRDRLVGHDLGLGVLDRQSGPDHLLVVVQQLDRDVFVDVRPAQQREAFFLLEVGQRERRVLVQLHVVAVEQERLAGRALPLLAAVHEHEALVEGGPQDRLLLIDLDLDANWLEPDDVLIAHPSPHGEAGKNSGETDRGAGGNAPAPRLARTDRSRRATVRSDERTKGPQASSFGNRPAGPALMYLAWNATRSSGVISLNRTFGLCTGPMRRRWSSVHIFDWSPSFRCGCAIMVLPSSRTKPMSDTTSAQFQPWYRVSHSRVPMSWPMLGVARPW